MLISFSVRNFRSIYEKQQLTFIATKYEALAKGLLREKSIPRGLLPIIAIYGANSAGKTNMLKALHFFARAISSSHNSWKPEAKIRRDSHFFHSDEPTEFECEFVSNKEIFRLGFSMNDDMILREHLYAGRKLIYRREGSRFRFGVSMKGYESIKRNTRPNALYISTAAQNNQPLLKKIHAWFASWDTITEDRTLEEASIGYLMQKEAMRSFLSRVVRIVNPDVISLESDDSNVVPEGKSKRRSLHEDLASWSRIMFVHQSKDHKHLARLMLIEESRGTQCYVALAVSILFALVTGYVLILDEADQSLHPTLLRSIILLFQSRETNPRNAQLIFNTHDTTLLTPEVMRPDEVWFADRDENLNSTFYCLADFKGIRSDTKAQRAYLEGRFGAIPFLENHTRIFAEEINPSTKRTNDAKA